jgi:hypothetical protein
MAYDFSHPTWMQRTVVPRNCWVSAASVSDVSDRINGSVPPQYGHVVETTTMSTMLPLDGCIGAPLSMPTEARRRRSRQVTVCVKVATPRTEAVA